MLKSFIRYNRAACEALIKKYPGFFGVPASYHTELMARIERSIGAHERSDLLEAGGIDRPLLEKSSKYNYVGLDIESKERCYDIYDEFLVQSIENKLDGSYDIIISKTLLEHVQDNRASVKVMFDALNAGGVMHHYVPSKWHPYSIALRIIGPRLQNKLIPLLRPAAVGVTGYPAFFNYCSVAEIKRLCDNTGFIDVDILAFYRANDYFAFFLPLFVLDTAFENFCRIFNISFFCSGFVVSAARPQISDTTK